MIAYLIDPHKRQVNQVEYDGNWETISTWINAEYYEIASINPYGDVAYVDEVGLIREDRGVPALFQLGPATLAGYALVLGTDDAGESIAPFEGIQALRERIHWINEVRY